MINNEFYLSGMIKELKILGWTPYPSPSPHSEHVNNIMELNGFRQTPVNDDVDDLTYHIYNAYYVVLTSTLGEKDDSIPRAIQRQLPYFKCQLYYLHGNPPPIRIRFFLCLCRCKPYIQVIYPHPWQSPDPIWMNSPHDPFNFIPGWEPVCHVNRTFQYGYGFPQRGYLSVEVCQVLCVLPQGFLPQGWLAMGVGGERGSVAVVLIPTIHIFPRFPWKGGSLDRRASISMPADFTRFDQLYLSFSLIICMRRRSQSWYLTGSLRPSARVFIWYQVSCEIHIVHGKVPLKFNSYKNALIRKFTKTITFKGDTGATGN